jgi:hypothetical protein
MDESFGEIILEVNKLLPQHAPLYKAEAIKYTVYVE